MPAAGAAFVASKIDAIAANPDVWAKTAFILNYDENDDALFDMWLRQVPPSGTPHEFVKGLPIGSGFRVPCLIVSPWTAGGWVCSQPFDHTSVLQFLEKFTGVKEHANISDWRRKTFGDLLSAFRFNDDKAGPPELPDASNSYSRAKYEAGNLPDPELPGAEQKPPTQEKGQPRQTRAARLRRILGLCRTGRTLFIAVARLWADGAQCADTPQTNAPTVLPTVIVSGTNTPSSLTSPSVETAKKQKLEVPGGFTIRDASEMGRGRGSSFQDLLRGVPGLTLQTENGMELTKISIRGSGILSDDEPLGVIFLLDGFPFNQGDGEVILEDFSLCSIQYAEVFRGANAFKYGAITLGGAVNLVSKTGYDADPFQIQLEGGSFGFLRSQLTSGGVEGPVDYYASVTGRVSDGYREHSYENTEDLFSNIGYKFSDNLENRLYLSVTRTDRLVPGGITKEEMDQNPRQVDPLSIAQGPGQAMVLFAAG